MDEGDIDFTDYLPKTTKDIGELWRTLTEFVATFQNPHLKSLVELFMRTRKLPSATAMLRRPRPFTMHTSADCSITSCHCSGPAIS